MKRTLVLALGLLVVPAVAAAQVEIGLDGGLSYYDEDQAADAGILFNVPVSGTRIGFMAGPNMIIETRLGLGWFKQGDANGSSLDLIPGLNYMVTPQVYVRGEAGLTRDSFDPGTGGGSTTQYLFGGGVGMRRSLGAGAVLRLEGGVEMGMENQDDGIPSYMEIHGTVGLSAVIGG